VFPEGTTSGDDTLLQFKVGAFLSGMPVQPVVVKYPFWNLECTWSCDIAPHHLAMRMLLQVFNRMTVHYLPVYYPSPAEQADPRLFAENVRRVMCEAMQPGTRLTEHAFEDVQLLSKAQQIYNRADPGVTAGCVTYSEINESLNLSLGDTMNLLKRFREADKKKSGFLSKEDVAGLLNLDLESPLTNTFFTLMDQRHSGSVNFRSFLQALVVGCNNLEKQDKVRLVFQMYDQNQSNAITKDEILNILAEHHRCTPSSISPDSSPGAKGDDAMELRGSGEARAQSMVALGDDIMAGRDCLEFSDFEAAVEQYPELMTTALDIIERGRSQAMGAEECC